MNAKLTTIIDPTLSAIKLRELHEDACCWLWEEQLEGIDTPESYKELTEIANAALAIAQVKEMGFNVTR